MMIDYIADPDGVVMKAGIVLTIKPLQQDSGNFHVKQMIEEESSDMQVADHGTGIAISDQEDRMQSESVFVTDRQIEVICRNEVIHRTANNIGNQDTIYDEINGEKPKKALASGDNGKVSNSHNTPTNAAIYGNIDIPNLVDTKPPKDPDNSSSHDVNTVASDHQTSPISVPLAISIETQSGTKTPTVRSMDEDHHNIFAAILEETRIKAEKEATIRAIEVVSSGRWDSTCFEDIVSQSLMDYVMLYQKACELSLHFKKEKSMSNLSTSKVERLQRYPDEAPKAVTKNGTEQQQQRPSSSPSAPGHKTQQFSTCALKTEFEYELPEEELEEDDDTASNDDSNKLAHSHTISPEVTYDQIVSMNKQQFGFPVLNVERNSFASIGYEMMGNLSSEYGYPLGKMGNLSSDWYSQQGTSDWSGVKDDYLDKSFGYIPIVKANYASPYQTELDDWRPGENPFQRKSVVPTHEAVDDYSIKSESSRKRVVPIINTKSKKFSPPVMK